MVFQELWITIVRMWELFIDICGPFYKHALTLIPAWTSVHMTSKVWYDITYPFLNFNGETVDV